MSTNQEIRRHNLELLVREVVAYTGKERGAVAHLARVTEVAYTQISQIRSGATHPNGSPRLLGDEVARKLEAGTNKQEGWMDRDHSKAQTVGEAELLDSYRAATDEQRKAILAMLAAMNQKK